ncbi:hypothetical protein KO516_15495 [Citreicella sp. C3M06]|uniref:hypothetical protein n=1 Tax=Citreicella sp. C3M06 TaxID=2841564 RepID=UPI001C090D13|nr:hypothetical protein [Citreicella sp. C3M06]MBU2962191.1 hypothetical protein [Citreicella sp. C3M06]
MEIRSGTPSLRRHAIHAVPAAAPPSAVTVHRRLPPPAPVTTKMLPLWKAARARDHGATRGYALARTMLQDE